MPEVSEKYGISSVPTFLFFKVRESGFQRNGFQVDSQYVYCSNAEPTAHSQRRNIYVVEPKKVDRNGSCTSYILFQSFLSCFGILTQFLFYLS